MRACLSLLARITRVSLPLKKSHLLPWIKISLLFTKQNKQCNQHFLLFLHCILPLPGQISISESSILSSANPFNLDQSKILLCGKELKKSDKGSPKERSHEIWLKSIYYFRQRFLNEKVCRRMEAYTDA